MGLQHERRLAISQVLLETEKIDKNWGKGNSKSLFYLFFFIRKTDRWEIALHFSQHNGVALSSVNK